MTTIVNQINAPLSDKYSKHIFKKNEFLNELFRHKQKVNNRTVNSLKLDILTGMWDKEGHYRRRYWDTMVLITQTLMIMIKIY